MKIKNYLFVFLGCFLFCKVEAQSDSSSSFISPSEKQFFQIVVEGNNQFAFDFYRFAKEDPGNICFSPYSITAALALPAIGAKGETAQQFQHLLHYSLSLLPLLSSVNELLHASTLNTKSTQLWLANALWLQNDLQIIPSFKIAMQRTFGLPLQLLNFKNEASQSIQNINEWTMQHTHQKVRSILTSTDITQQTRSILTAAIWMKGQWEQPFEIQKTKRLPFYVSSQRSFSSSIMKNVSHYSLWQGDKWEMLEIPYQQENQELQMVMTVLLPKEGQLNELESHLNLVNWKQWLSSLKTQFVSLSLPRFRFEDRFDLQTILKALGLSFIFDIKADFSGIMMQKDFFLNRVIHKTTFDVDEKGSNVGYDILNTKGQKVPSKEVNQTTPYEFVANRPFIFIIWDKKTGLIFWMGRLALP